METKQYRLCEEVLRRLHAAGVLDGLVVAGSWCVLFYQAYFDSKSFTATIRTRDLDLAVPVPTCFKGKVDVGELLDDLGFVVDFRGEPGHMRFMHPDLILEFLVPERGRGSDDAFDIPELGVNAQRLRYLDLSLTDTVTVDFRGIPLRLPHPVRFALHKLIVAERRSSDKAENDRAQAVMVLQAVRETDEAHLIMEVYSALSAKCRRCRPRHSASRGQKPRRLLGISRRQDRARGTSRGCIAAGDSRRVGHGTWPVVAPASCRAPLRFWHHTP